MRAAQAESTVKVPVTSSRPTTRRTAPETFSATGMNRWKRLDALRKAPVATAARRKGTASPSA